MEAVFSGSRPASASHPILLNVPGAAGAVMTTLGGNPTTRNGDAGRALSLSGEDWAILVQDCKSITIYVLAVLVVIAPIWLARRARLMEGDPKHDEG